MPKLDLNKAFTLVNPIIIGLTLLFSNSLLFAQKDSIGYKYNSFFELNRESIYLHLNKTTYISGESVWFSGYIKNRKIDKPSIGTSQMILGVYDSIGNQILKYRYRVDDGFTQGHFDIDSTFQSGSYYVKATTPLMQELKENAGFNQVITIIRDNKHKTHTIDSSQAEIRFFPEGQNLISDINNTVAFKLFTKKGLKVPFLSARLYDEYDYKLLNINGNENGVSKFSYTPKEELNYSLKVTLKNGEEKTYSLPLPLKKGIGLSIEDKGEEYITITIRLNEKTFNRLNNKNLSLLIHRDGKAKKIDIQIEKGIRYNKFKISRLEFQKGVNFITLFSSNNDPISETVYFNADSLPIYPVEKLIVAQKSQDSLSVGISIKEVKNISKVSVSVLPEGTISNFKNQDIFSSFYLNPYIRKSIKDVDIYYKDNVINKEAIDLLMLTRGDSQYDWKRILKTKKSPNIKIRKGISLTGSVVGKRKANRLYIHPGSAIPSQMIVLTDQKFRIENMYPIYNKPILFSSISKSGRISKPSLLINIGDKLPPDILYPNELINLSRGSINKAQIKTPAYYNFTEGDSLDEVILTGKSRQYSEASSNPNVPQFLKNKISVVTQETVFRFPSFLEIIKSRGYFVRDELNFTSEENLSGGRVTIRLRTYQSFSGARALPAPIIYLNDIRLIDFDQLSGLRTEDLESYYFQRNGASEGLRGAGGVIRIYTRRNYKDPLPSIVNTKNISQNKTYKFTIPNGFQAVKKFKNVAYQSYSDQPFINYGLIHWEPEVLIKNGDIYYFSIKDTGLKKINFYIEGMSEDGSLISTIKTVQVKKSIN